MSLVNFSAEVPQTSTAVSTPATAADAFAMIDADPTLTLVQRRDQASALRALVQICRHVDTGNATAATILDAAAYVPLDCEFLRKALFKNSPARLGIDSGRTFANKVSLVRGILRRMGLHAAELPPFEGLDESWKVLVGSLKRHTAMGVIGFAAWSTVHGVLPHQVTQEALDSFEIWLQSRTLEEKPHDRARRTASTWNWASANNPGWPQVRLVCAGMSDKYSLPWDAYPKSLVAEVDDFIDRLAGLGNDDLAEGMFSEDGPAAGARALQKPKRARTQKTRRDCLKIAAAALVVGGVPAASLTSLRNIVTPPDRPRAILRFHKERTRAHLLASASDPRDVPELRDIKSSNLLNIAETLRQASIYCKLPDEEINAIRDMRKRVTKNVQVSMAEAPRQKLTALIEPRPMALFLALPAKLMEAAEDLAEAGDTRRAALLAMVATALEILSCCPLRRNNLIELRLDTNLLRTQPRALIHEIFVPANKVKTEEAIETPLLPESARLIETYLRKYRPHLADATNPYLFPAQKKDGERQPGGLAAKIKTIVERETGVAFNLHLARHFAVFQYLKAHPGDYETARRLLGHKRVETTIRFYAGLEARFAFLRLGVVIRDERHRARLTTKMRLRRSPKGAGNGNGAGKPK